jgi:hypothetical protein
VYIKDVSSLLFFVAGGERIDSEMRNEKGEMRNGREK